MRIAPNQVRQPTLARRREKVLSKVVVIFDPDGTLSGKPGWPSQLWIAETVVEDEEFASLLEGRARVHQCPGPLACFHDDGRLGQRRHCDVAIGEEVAVEAKIL